jgi:hypothetical protein
MTYYISLKNLGSNSTDAINKLVKAKNGIHIGATGEPAVAFNHDNELQGDLRELLIENVQELGIRTLLENIEMREVQSGGFPELSPYWNDLLEILISNDTKPLQNYERGFTKPAVR